MTAQSIASKFRRALRNKTGATFTHDRVKGENNVKPPITARTDGDSSANDTAFTGHGLTTDIAARVEHHADLILRAAGSGLRHYSMPGTRRAILSAMMDAYAEACRTGAENADEVWRERFKRELSK